MTRMGREPRRTCVGCRTVRDQRALVRLTADAEGNLLVNPRRTHGRGAYVCPSTACLAEAWRRRAISRALRRDLPGMIEAMVREQFGMELRRRGLAADSVQPGKPAEAHAPGRSRRGAPPGG